ncbi:MAG: hypothetical protein HZA37_00215 [Parcubacteria group bacterium]|nr:hypothetical protein [Parcubacteria group bacterium]
MNKPDYQEFRMTFKKTIFFAIFLTAVTVGLFSPLASFKADAYTGSNPTVEKETKEERVARLKQEVEDERKQREAEDEDARNKIRNTPENKASITSIAKCIYAGNGAACLISASLSLATDILTALLFAVMHVMSRLFELAGFLVNFAVNLNAKALIHPVVKIGWTVTRDLANLGFVLAVIIIAFTTIVRMSGFETKKMLGKLIAAAILINFSFVIAGVFTDFAGMLGTFFLDKSGSLTGTKTELAGRLMDSFGLQSFSSTGDTTKTTKREITNCDNPGFGGYSEDFFRQCPKITKKIPPAAKDDYEAMKDDADKVLKMIVSLVFAILFTVLGTISFLGIAATLLVRYIALGMLMILMPLAWLFWILPTTEGLWKQWWQKFMQYVFFFPAVSFFLYLAVAITFFQGLTEDLMNKNGAGPNPNKMVMQQDISSTIAQMILVLGFLVGGLMVSQKLGVAGGGAGLAMAQKAKGAAKNYMNNRATGVKNRALSRYGQGAANTLAGIPGFRGVALRIGAATAGISESVKKMQEAFSKMSGDALKKMAPGLGASAAKKAAWANAAAGKGILSENDARAYLPHARQTGTDKDILAVFPHLAESAEKMARAARGGDITKMHTSALANPAVLSMLSKGQYKEYINKQSLSDIATLKINVDNASNNTSIDNEIRSKLRTISEYFGKNPVAQNPNEEEYE